MHGESVSCSNPTKLKPNSKIECIDLMRLIGIDSQMIAKDKNMNTIVQRLCS